MITWQVLRNSFPGPLIRAAYGLEAAGFENFPRDGGALVVSNHLSHSDPIFLQLAVPRQLTFCVDAGFYRWRGVPGVLMRQFLSACEAVPVDPQSQAAAAQLISVASTVINHGGLFCIYPEGGISWDGKVHRGRTGIGRIVAATGASVIPVGMVNTDRVIPPVRRRPIRESVKIRVGKPLNFHDRSAPSSEEGWIRSTTDEVMRALQLLTGREYVDTYVLPRPTARKSSRKVRTDVAQATPKSRISGGGAP